MDSAPPGYHLIIEGTLDGAGVSVELLVDGGTVQRLDGGDCDEALTIDAMFALITRAVAADATVDADFNDTWGFPSRLMINGADFDVDLVVNEFAPFTRPTGCASPPGSPTDLAAEPAAWLLYGEFNRWTDNHGCPVRIDVISAYDGPEHCDWQQIDFLTIGLPVGSPFSDESSSTYVWDPHDILGDFDNVDRGRTIDIADLPDTAIDAGFHQADSELWLDPRNPALAYRVVGDTADVLVRDLPRRLLCL